MSEHEANQQRLLDLLADRAVFGLSQDEENELASLQQSHPDVDDHEMDRIVALLESSNPRLHRDSMPDEVRAKISAASDANARSVESPTANAPNASKSSLARKARRDLLVGALAAAATLLIAAMLWQPSTTPTLSLSQRRDQVIANAPDLVRINWTPTNRDDAYSGDVVWSEKLQKGFMRFEGLPINDPKREQYQLWIFDSVQDVSYPIDGGVFDVTGGEAIVEIDAKLKVVGPAWFAVTVERPGGVVVSDRSRLPLIAKKSDG